MTFAPKMLESRSTRKASPYDPATTVLSPSCAAWGSRARFVRRWPSTTLVRISMHCSPRSCVSGGPAALLLMVIFRESLYGQYVACVLQQEVERHPGQVEHVQDEAVSIARVGETAEIRLRSGRTLFADKVVIALGNLSPGDPRLPGRTPHSVRYVSNSWKASALGDVSGDKSVLLVGSGLTSVDVAITLRQRGFRGTIQILSRRGLLPQAHKATAA